MYRPSVPDRPVEAPVVPCRPADATPVVSTGLSSSVLMRIRQPTTGLAIWRRPARLTLSQPAAALLAFPPFSRVAEGNPAHVLRSWATVLPAASRRLLGDVLLLARLFATVTGTETVRLRLEHVTSNACREFHVDGVGLRLLCTYAGPGTEWLEPNGELERLAEGEVGIFKGAAYPDTAERVPHRSPPVEQLAPERRSRLLLCIDEPGRFPVFPVPRHPRPDYPRQVSRA